MASVWHKVLLWMIFWDVTLRNKKSGGNIFESPTKHLRQHVHTLFLDNKLPVMCKASKSMQAHLSMSAKRLPGHAEKMLEGHKVAQNIYS